MTARDLAILFLACLTLGAGVILCHDGDLLQGLPVAALGFFGLSRVGA